MTHAPPTYRATAFSCPYCHAFAAMTWSGLTMMLHGRCYNSAVDACRCGHCSKLSFWLTSGEESGRMIVPDAAVAPAPHEEMSDAVRCDYNEARSIAQRSPRAAAALLRLAIQRLCAELGERGKNINDDIGALVKKGLPVEIQQALDIVRVVGNNAVHPGELDSEDVTEVANLLFDLVNQIVEDRIARPKKLAALFERLPEGARESIRKRDS